MDHVAVGITRAAGPSRRNAPLEVRQVLEPRLPSSARLLTPALDVCVHKRALGGHRRVRRRASESVNGVRLIGGTHSDGFRSTSFGGLLEVFVGSATGFSTPENVAAVQVLSQGWITDIYAGTVYDKDAEHAGDLRRTIRSHRHPHRHRHRRARLRAARPDTAAVDHRAAHRQRLGRLRPPELCQLRGQTRHRRVRAVRRSRPRMRRPARLTFR